VAFRPVRGVYKTRQDKAIIKKNCQLTQRILTVALALTKDWPGLRGGGAIERTRGRTEQLEGFCRPLALLVSSSEFRPRNRNTCRVSSAAPWRGAWTFNVSTVALSTNVAISAFSTACSGEIPTIAVQHASKSRLGLASIWFLSVNGARSPEYQFGARVAAGATREMQFQG
jgi:hypothetical protein